MPKFIVKVKLVDYQNSNRTTQIETEEVII